jgi:signal transduction histidine kinase
MAETLRQQGDVEAARLLGELSGEMADRVDYQLRLSRLHLRTRTLMLSASLNSALSRTIAVLQKTRDGETLDWILDAPEALQVDIDQHDLFELVGVLLENAAKWGRTMVRVRARRIAANAEVVISDDGPGLTDDEIGSIGARGQRLDLSTKGSGLGLAIAMEIVSINNGSVVPGRAEEGGLRITLTLPLAKDEQAALLW